MNVLAIQTAVCDVAVVGIPKAEHGEIVIAYVVPRVVDADADTLAADPITFCRDRLAHFKCPRLLAAPSSLGVLVS